MASNRFIKCIGLEEEDVLDYVKVLESKGNKAKALFVEDEQMYYIEVTI